jgi:hypothetical protein
MLRIHNIVHRYHIINLTQYTAPYATEFLHMTTCTDQQTQVNTEGTDVGPRLARYPKYTEIALLVIFNQFTFVYRPNAELALHSRYKGRTLEQRSRECFHSSVELLRVLNGGMESNHPDVLFTRRLLSLDETGGTIDAYDETAGDFWIEGARMSRFVDA